MTDKTEIVVDTNVWIAAAFNPQSDSARILQGLQESRWRLRWNAITRDEIQTKVTDIPPIRHQWQDFAALFQGDNNYTGSTHPDQFQNQIPGKLDRHFAALADATGAVLITRDDHFLAIKEQLSIYVVRPSVFCRQFACPSPDSS